MLGNILKRGSRAQQHTVSWLYAPRAEVHAIRTRAKRLVAATQTRQGQQGLAVVLLGIVGLKRLGTDIGVHSGQTRCQGMAPCRQLDPCQTQGRQAHRGGIHPDFRINQNIELRLRHRLDPLCPMPEPLMQAVDMPASPLGFCITSTAGMKELYLEVLGAQMLHPSLEQGVPHRVAVNVG